MARILTSLQCLILLVAAHGTLVAAPLTLQEIVLLKSVAAARLSPDGQRIAYILAVPRKPYVDDDGPAYRELHVVDLDGSSRPFITGDVAIREVAWSADGSQLYYLAKRDDDAHTALYAIATDGGESRKVYEHATAMADIKLSPDGRRLAFLAEDAPPELEEELADKGFKAVVYEESARATGVWLLDLQAAEPEALRVDLPGTASLLEWAPDGARYVVALAPTPLVDDFYVGRRLHVVAADTGAIMASMDHEAKLGGAAWSPDATRIAFIAGEDRNDPREGRIFVARADGTGLQNITPDYPGHVHDVVWRDADTLLYRGSRGLWVEIGTAGTDGTAALPPISGGNPIARTLDTRPGIAHAAVIADSPAHPDEVYVWDEGTGLRRLTDSNPWLAERDLAVQEPLRFRARDGLEIEGVLIRPLNERPGERHPLIMVIHGGPESHYSHGWMSGYSFPAQAMAAEGFAFYYPNYRASTGRGIEFSKLDHGDPAGREFDDLVDAKRFIVESGLADPGRVGITGGSYGGYATLWGATAFTAHFAAAVAFVGISDLIGSLGTSDIPNELYLVHLRQWPWEDWEFALQRSPIYHAGRSRTPTLILGGDADPRLDPSQSLAMYRHMKLRTDTPVRLVRYPGEGHGNNNTAARLDYALRMHRWMNHYLNGPGGAPPPYELDHAARLEAAKQAGD